MRAIVAVVVVALASGAASAQVLLPDLPRRVKVTEEAQNKVLAARDRAQQHYANGNLDKALEAAEEAYTTVPNASTALVKAFILGELERHREALDAYLIAHDLGPPEQQRSQVVSGLREQSRLSTPPMGVAVISITPAGAKVTIGGKTFVGTRTVGLPVGDHTVRVEAKGYKTRTEDVAIAAGAAANVSLQLVKPTPIRINLPRVDLVPEDPPAPEPKAPEVVHEENVEPEDQTASYVLLASGGALLAAALGVHMWALDAKNEADKHATPGAESGPERSILFEAAKDDLETRSTMAYVLYGLGAAYVTAGLVLFFIRDDAEEGESGARPGVGVSPSGAVVQLEGRF